MSNRLTNLEITEVSFVDKPADPNARIELFKRDSSDDEDIDKNAVDGYPTSKNSPTSQDVMVPEVLGSKKPKKRKRDDDEDMELEKASDSSYSPARTDTEERHMPEMDFTPEQETYVRTLEDAKMDADEVVKTLEAEIEVLKADETDDSPSDDILKSASPEVVELVKAAEARAADAEEIAKGERETRLRRDAVAKAAEYDTIGVDVEELGGLLYDAGEVLPEETMEKLHEVLKVAKEAADVAGLYSEIGKSGEGLNDAEATLDGQAKEIQKNSPELTYEQAYEKALDANPEAYEQTIGG